MIIDKGMGLSQTGDLLEIGCDYIDYIKFGFGTAALYSRAVLRSKIAMITSYGVNVYPGGTFLEIAVVQDRLDEYLRRCKELGFTHIEVSVSPRPNCFRHLVLPNALSEKSLLGSSCPSLVMDRPSGAVFGSPRAFI